MTGWPPAPELVAASLLSLLGFLLWRMWLRLSARVDRLEDETLSEHEIDKRFERIERALVGLQASVTEGFRDARAQAEVLIRDMHVMDTASRERVSALVRDVHKKVEVEVAALRREIAEVRSRRATD